MIDALQLSHNGARETLESELKTARSLSWWAVVIASVMALVSCGDATTEDDPPKDPGDAVNPFHPKELADAANALKTELGDQPNAGSVKLGVVANYHVTYWTAAQIGMVRASSEIGFWASFDATSDGLPTTQHSILERMIGDGFAGIAVSPIDGGETATWLADGNAGDANVITFDADTLDGAERPLYVGTLNFEAGKAAGAKMAELLGNAGGKVALFSGFETATNSQERIAGVTEALEGTNVEIVGSYFDDNVVPNAIANVEAALDEHPDLAGIIGIFAQNGPAALSVLEDEGKVGDIKIVAFDLAPETLSGLASGKIDAAIGQRPYWMGYLSPIILYAMDALGVNKTKEILASWLKGDNEDLFDTGQDVVTPDNIETYNQYLVQLGVGNQ